MINRHKPAIEIIDASSGNLKNISLKITPGTLVLVSGPIGSGKSTLLMEVIAKESRKRIEQMQDPSRLLNNLNNISSKQIINNLPLTLSISGEDPLPSSRSIGESFGLLKLIGQLFKESKFRTCPVCESPLKHVSITENIELILKKLSVQKNSTVKIFALTKATKDSYEEAKNTWIQKGFEQHGPLISKGETAQLYFETTVDLISYNDITAKRLNESLNLSLATSALCCRIEISSKLGSVTDSIWVYRNWFCGRCYEEYPNLKPSDFEIGNLSKPHEKLSCSAKCMLDHTAIDPNFQYTGRMLSRLPIMELRSTVERFCPSAKSLQERLSLIFECGLSQQNISSSLKELTPSQYLSTKLAKIFALASEASLIILDEPILTWDQSAFTLLSTKIKTHTKQGGTVLISSMRPEFEQLADTIIRLGPGSGIEGGDIISNPTGTSLPSSKTVELKSSSGYYIQQTDQSLPTTEISWKEIKGSSKTVSILLKLHPVMALLFSSTVTAKSLGLTDKDFMPESKKRSQLVTQIQFKEMTMPEIEELTLQSAAVFFADILKIKNKIEPAIQLGLGHLRLGQLHSSLSLRERILMSLASLIVTNPNNRLIVINQILDLLPAEIAIEVSKTLPQLLPKQTAVKFISTHPAIRDLPNCARGAVSGS